VREAGYNAWADANHLVILYPQTTQWLRPLADPAGFTANPKGCWDWWGYSGSAYLTRDGKQMKAVRAMIAHLVP
jgi:poly(3-hydroxybutyrate) depolymerase